MLLRLTESRLTECSQVVSKNGSLGSNSLGRISLGRIVGLAESLKKEWDVLKKAIS